MTPVEFAIVAVAAMLAVAALVNGLDLWKRRRSLRSIVPTRIIPLPGPIPTVEQARQWRLQAVDEEHAFWDERFRAAGGIPPLRQADRERVDRMYGGYFFAPYMGSNSRFASAEYGTKARSMKRRFLDMTAEPHAFWGASTWVGAFDDQPCVHCGRVAVASAHVPRVGVRTDWRTPLRDLVDPR